MSGAKVTVGIPTRNRAEWLRIAISSVLAQSYGDFELLISDNASTDSTASVVASFDDPRLVYHRSSADAGMFGNLNRVVELAETEYLVVLPDDDLLYPDYLLTILAVLEAKPSVSVAHSAFDFIDSNGTVLERGRMLLPSTGNVTLETGGQLIERAMRRSGVVCWTSACFRKSALVAAGGIRPADAPYADASLMMRLGLRGDFACVSQPLVAVRIHAAAESASAGAFTGSRYDLNDDTPAILYRQRIEFLDEADLPEAEDRRYRALALRSYRRETIGRLTADLTARRQNRLDTVRRLRSLWRSDRRLPFNRATLKLALRLVAPLSKRSRS